MRKLIVCNIVSLDESPLVLGLLYVGTDDGLVQVTEDGGANWRRIEKLPGVPDRAYVSRLEPSPRDAAVVYAAFDNHKMGDFKPYVLKSTDGGATWHNLDPNDELQVAFGLPTGAQLMPNPGSLGAPFDVKHYYYATSIGMAGRQGPFPAPPAGRPARAEHPTGPPRRASRSPTARW